MENRVTIPIAELDNYNIIYVDGKEYTMQIDGDNYYVDLPDANATNLIAFNYHIDDINDVHAQYPANMKVWLLENINNTYSVNYIKEFDNILIYAGTSLRSTSGNKGIRTLTAIDKIKKEMLISSNLVGYTLKETGTALAWASQISKNKPLILGKSYVSSSKAYIKDSANPVYRIDEYNEIYTNVISGFNNSQCANDMAFRPYMIITDGEKDITLYGGIVKRSVGYIVYQIRNIYSPGSSEYEYVWGVIRAVYGDRYDNEYIQQSA